jgi:light-regulated signal transduction histidine kinase (bacteriophytochrome)
VLAEDTDGVLPSYLNLRFPAADIPAQARELYKLSRIRLIPTADYTPAPVIPPLSPIDGQPLDLGRAGLRSVSPVHLEYMRNMGTQSSMSISIVVEGRLWGLVSGHSADARQVNAQVRSVCDHLGQVLSLQIEAREQALRTARSLALREVQTELLARVAAAPDYAAGLARSPEAWQDVGGGVGAALVSGGEVIAVGLAPDPDDIRAIAERLWADRRQEAAIESLAEEWPDLAPIADVASGVLAVSISQLHPNYLMWFRPEVVRTVEWAGEPQKARELGERLHPRKSFALWKEQVRLRALPWAWEEVDSVRAFRGAIQDFVLRRAEERAELTTKLAEINRELESFSYSISHDLRAPFRHVVGFAELLAARAKGGLDATSAHYLASIKDAALSAGRLVDDLLSFSQLGRHSLRHARVDMGRAVAEIRRGLEPGLAGRKVQWIVGPLPPAWGDAAMLRQVLANLIENAVKYAAPRNPAIVEITGEDLPAATSYTVTDNGVGFDMAYAHKLFAVFERLHRAEEFEGTGIGLALVRRIVERHGGTVSAHGALNAGASFTFTLPKRGGADLSGETILG